MSLKSNLKNQIVKGYYKQTEHETEDIINVSINYINANSVNIYYTLSILNKLIYDPPNPVRSIPKIAKTIFTKNDIILNNPEDYRVCITRLSIPSNAIPLFLFPVEEASFTISLTYVNGPVNVQYTKNINYIQSNIGDPYERFQPVYYIQEMLNFVNTALSEAYDDIKADVGVNYTPTQAPFIRFDSKTKLFSLIAHDDYLDINKFGIFMNKPLFDGFFSGFYSRSALFGLGQFNGIQLLPQNLGNNIIEIPAGGGIFFVIQDEEFSSVSAWYKADRILVSSNMIPINTSNLATQLDIQLNVILDFILPDVELDRKRYEYNPMIYKWYDLKQQKNLRKFDLSYYILFESGNIIELYINGNNRIDTTLLFTNKNCLYQ